MRIPAIATGVVAAVLSSLFAIQVARAQPAGGIIADLRARTAELEAAVSVLQDTVADLEARTAALEAAASQTAD